VATAALASAGCPAFVRAGRRGCDFLTTLIAAIA
jgi:hypothetical protein